MTSQTSAPDRARRRPWRAAMPAAAALSVAALLGTAVVSPITAAVFPAYAGNGETIAAQDLDVEASGTGIAQRDAYTAAPKPTPTPTPEPVVETASVPTVAAAPAPFYTGGGSSTEWLAAAGIPESDWAYVDFIVSRESGWNPNATNPSSGACGLVQANPCSKVPGGGYDPIANLSWANGYAVGRYGSWAGAYAFWTSNHWW